MARVIDLDAKRVARAEAQGDPPEVVLGGERFSLPVELPLETLDLMADGQFREAFSILLGGEVEMRRLFRHRPTDADLEELMGVYGDAPESLASPRSSAATGTRSRPTGRPPTSGTSRRTATAPTGAAPAGS